MKRVNERQFLSYLCSGRQCQMALFLSPSGEGPTTGDLESGTKTSMVSVYHIQVGQSDLLQLI